MHMNSRKTQGLIQALVRIVLRVLVSLVRLLQSFAGSSRRVESRRRLAEDPMPMALPCPYETFSVFDPLFCNNAVSTLTVDLYIFFNL